MMKYLSQLGPVDAVEHYKYHTSQFISRFSLDIIEQPTGYKKSFWMFNPHNDCFITRRCQKFRFAFQLWQGKRAINAPLPKIIKEQDYVEFKKRLTKHTTMDPFMIMAIKDKAKEYFKDYKVPSLRMELTNKSCYERSNLQEFVKEYYNIPTLKPYNSLLQLSHHNIAAKQDFLVMEPRGTSVQLDEPMKVRTITKMCHTQLLYKRVQQSLLDYIQKKSPEFVLTKDPSKIMEGVKQQKINEFNLSKSLMFKKMVNFEKNNCFTTTDLDHNLTTPVYKNEKYRELSETDLYYCSGDYKAATDNLKRVLITSVIEQLPLNSFEKQFGDAIIDDFLAVNGQLMGSILSFPILCVINKFVYEYVQDLIPNQSSKPLINGDDILFKGTLHFIKSWYHYTNEAGFIPSKGKSLIDKNNFTINSRPFNVNGMQKFANLKLTHLTGNCSEDCNNIKKFHLETYGETLHKGNFKKSLQYFPTFGKSRSWKIWRKFKSEHMPQEAGGLGLFNTNESELTHTQKLYTSYYLTSVKKQPLTQLQREVGVSPFIAKTTNNHIDIPKVKELEQHFKEKCKDFQLRKYPQNEQLEKLRYMMLSSRFHESEGAWAFHQ